MFSKFLSGKNESSLAALEVQWRMEFAKAKRKFDKSKESKKKSGRPPLGTLKMNTLKKDGKTIDLTKIARGIATTREGRRLHHQVTEQIQKSKENNSISKNVITCLFGYGHELSNSEKNDICIFC